MIEVSIIKIICIFIIGVCTGAMLMSLVCANKFDDD